MRGRISPQTVARYSALHPWKTIGLWAVLLLAAMAVIGSLLSGALTAQYSFVGKPDSQVAADLRVGLADEAVLRGQCT